MRTHQLMCRAIIGCAVALVTGTVGAATVQPNDDFEATNPFVNYNGPVQFGGSMAVSTERVHTGDQSIKAVATNGTASNVFAGTSGAAPWTEVWVRSYINVDSITSDGFGGVNDKLSVIGGYGGGGVGIPFNVFVAPFDANSGRLVIEMSANGGGGEGTFRSPNPVFVDGPVVTYDQWHYLEAHWVNGIGAGEDGFEVFLNDATTPVLSIGFRPDLSTSQVVSQVAFGASAAAVYNGGGVVYFDNYAIDDANQLGPVPEPATLGMLVLGAALASGRRRV